MPITFSEKETEEIAKEIRIHRALRTASSDPRAEGKYLVGYVKPQDNRVYIKPFNEKSDAESFKDSLNLTSLLRSPTNKEKVCWMC